MYIYTHLQYLIYLIATVPDWCDNEDPQVGFVTVVTAVLLLVVMILVVVIVGVLETMVLLMVAGMFCFDGFSIMICRQST